jgi:hypothetical protein
MQILAQVALQRLMQAGIKAIKADIDILDEVFRQYTCPPMDIAYGQEYIDNIKTWFANTKIPVVQSWGYDPTNIPQITINLSSESEDEGRAAFDDHLGANPDTADAESAVNVFNVNLDIGLHVSKNGDEVLWLYYIASYILFKNKRLAEYMGLQQQTFSAADYSRQTQYAADNIWVRWIKFSCTVQNMWFSQPFITIDDLQLEVDEESANINSQSSPDPVILP